MLLALCCTFGRFPPRTRKRRSKIGSWAQKTKIKKRSHHPLSSHHPHRPHHQHVTLMSQNPLSSHWCDMCHRSTLHLHQRHQLDRCQKQLSRCLHSPLSPGTLLHSFSASECEPMDLTDTCFCVFHFNLSRQTPFFLLSLLLDHSHTHTLTHTHATSTHRLRNRT